MHMICRRRCITEGVFASVVIPAKAGIEYAAAYPHVIDVSGILDHPHARVMTG